jgi:uncharacterized protein (TIGR03382 family)
VVNDTPVWNKTGGNGKLGWNGVSEAGIAVGSDSRGPLATEGACLADVSVSTNTVYTLPAFPGSSGRGQGNGISNNATATAGYAAGYFYPSLGSDDSLHAFRHTLGAATVELLPAGGDVVGSQQTNAFDVSNNGTVVGFSYNSHDGQGNLIAGYRAAIWAPGSTAGILLQDILAANGVGLGDFSSLERCISITADGTTIAGRGVLTLDGSYRGFVATIPEPATMSFLALGGLALLRRRR